MAAWGCVLFVSTDAERVGILLDKARHPPGKPSFPHPGGGRHEVPYCGPGVGAQGSLPECTSSFTHAPTHAHAQPSVHKHTPTCTLTDVHPVDLTFRHAHRLTCAHTHTHSRASLSDTHSPL